MQKSLIAIALIGTASAAGYVKSWNPLTFAGYFTMTVKAAADAGYTTGYQGKDGSTHSEKYGLEIYSYANLTLGMEFFDSYKHQMMFSVIPLHVVPYSQSVSWMRPEDKNGQSVSFMGDRQIHILKLTTTITENVKTCGASFYDTVQKMDVKTLAPVCAYDSTTETNYEDNYWKYEPLKDLNLGWYGEGNWWNANPYTQAA